MMQRSVVSPLGTSAPDSYFIIPIQPAQVTHSTALEGCLHILTGAKELDLYKLTTHVRRSLAAAAC